MSDLVRMSPPTLSKGRLWAALAVILFGQFVVSIDLTVLNMALPDLTQDLHPTSDQLLWIVDVYSLVLAGLLVATSALSDRIGRKTALLTGFFLFGLGSALVMVAESAEAVIAIRAFLGVAGALIMPVTISMVRSIFTDAKERAFAVAAWSAIAALGMVAGPLVGGFLLEHFSWHAAFFVNVPFMAVALIMGIFVLPEVKVLNPGKFDMAASLIFLAGMVAFLWGIKHVAAELEFDTAGIAALIIGVLLLAVFIVRTLKSDAPLVDLSLFRSKTFTAGVVATAGSTFAMAVLLYLLSQWLQLVNGDGSFEAGMRLVPMAIASLVASAGASMLGMRFRARNVIVLGMIVAAVALMMPVAFRDDLDVNVILISTTLVGIGTGALALGASLMMCETPVEKASSAGSLQEISYDLGNVLGVSILGSVASIIYRESLNTSQLRDMGLDGQTINLCEQSFSNAAMIANETGMTDLFNNGANAFNDSVALTCLVGGIIILVVAAIVWMLIPRDMKITEDVESREQGAAGELNGAAAEDAPSAALMRDGQGEGGVLASAFSEEENVALDEVREDAAPSKTNAAAISDDAIDDKAKGDSAAVMGDANLNAAQKRPVSESEVRVDLDPKVLRRMRGVCCELGITPEIAMRMFAYAVVREKRIPFDLSLESKLQSKSSKKKK